MTFRISNLGGGTEAGMMLLVATPGSAMKQL
jgi:hypothetical protein